VLAESSGRKGETMYYAYELINREWREIGAGTCGRALEAHLDSLGIVNYWIMGW
jgi:hypothetical protein